MLSSATKSLANFAAQHDGREGLLQKQSVFFQDAMAYHRFVAVSGQKENFQPGPMLLQLLCQLASPHLGHYHVGNE